MNPSKLVNGRIPPHTICPFREQCGSADGKCYHTGLDHTKEFSCGYARAFDLIQRYERPKQ